jgi:hypothetical protein
MTAIACMGQSFDSSQQQTSIDSTIVFEKTNNHINIQIDKNYLFIYTDKPDIYKLKRVYERRFAVNTVTMEDLAIFKYIATTHDDKHVRIWVYKDNRTNKLVRICIIQDNIVSTYN